MNKLLTTLAIVSILSVVLIAGCKKDKTDTGNPIVIPVQTIEMATVPLAGASNFAVFAGSAITSTGATSVTGDLGLSPGTSVGGFPPGLYKSTSSLAISSGDLTFDAKGNASAVFIIQIASSLTTTSGRKVILSGSASASNIFWQVGTSATIGTTSVFKGTIMADQSISMNTGATIEGRLLARIAAVTLNSNTIVKK